MGLAPASLYSWAANPSRYVFLCLYTSLFYFILLLSPFPSFYVFISLYADFIVLAFVFLSELSSAAYMTFFLA